MAPLETELTPAMLVERARAMRPLLREQREIFGPAGDFRSPHRAAPAGTFERAEGGYIVNGVWTYSSGVPISTHFIGGAVIPVPDGAAGCLDIARPDSPRLASGVRCAAVIRNARCF
jgi:hypothetical protein